MSKTGGKAQSHLFSDWPGQLREPVVGDRYARDQVSLYFDYAENLYVNWPTPTCIISDGPYGVSGFPGDNHQAESLAEWYEPHIKAWSNFSTPQTTLWFWNTEVGWATVHPVLAANGWEYRCCNIWDKGLGHIAGNANTRTLRKFPVVTEVCVHYVKAATFQVGNQILTMQEWLRHEWKRTRLPLRLANEACKVLNAATRKYLTADHLWYYPPPEAFVKMAEYANEHGDPTGRPYFSLDGRRPIAGEQWAKLRAKFQCEIGITNVWREPQVSGAERIQGTRNGMKYKFRSLHGSQKPLKFIEWTIRASTDKGDVVWEPFGGLCPGAVVSYHFGRQYHGAEIIPEFYLAAVERLAAT
ncbi:MAG: DNA methyltransferase [Thermodesulfobacteriota bacterium]